MTPLALALRALRRPAVLPIPVTRAEQDTCRALERCGVDRELILRVVLPLTRPTPAGPR